MKLRLSKKSIKLIVDVMQEYEDIMENSGVKNQNFARHDWIKYFKNLK